MKLSDEQMYEKINEVSPSFCLAKWLQVTIDLQNGSTHSCHHPPRHSISIEELRENPSALHNTNYKKKLRKQMLDGERPAECQYCWRIEDLDGDHASDRLMKSSTDWAFNKLEQVKSLPWDYDVQPTYLEVMFENTCNMACMYCNFTVSSKINNMIKNEGPYPREIAHMGNHFRTYEQKRVQAFQDAFWKWLPDIISGLNILRVTGGEPLLSKHLDLMLDYMLEHPMPDLNFSVNSNLSIPSNRVEKFAQKIEKLLSNKCIKSFYMFVSIDSIGERAEYIRTGLDYELFDKNLNILRKHLVDCEIVIMCAFNLLSIPKLKDFLEQVNEWKLKHDNFNLDLAYLSFPPYLAPNLIPESFHSQLKDCVDYVGENEEFNEYELTRMLNMYHLSLETNKSPELKRKFAMFIQEYDRRSGQSFTSIFPELFEFYQECKTHL